MGFLECVLFLLPYRVFIPLVHSLFLESSLLIAFPSPNSATSFTFQFICDFLTDSSQTFKSKSYWEKKRKENQTCQTSAFLCSEHIIQAIIHSTLMLFFDYLLYWSVSIPFLLSLYFQRHQYSAWQAVDRHWMLNE